jgi:hypothetical protein
MVVARRNVRSGVVVFMTGNDERDKEQVRGNLSDKA